MARVFLMLWLGILLAAPTRSGAAEAGPDSSAAARPAPRPLPHAPT